MNKLDGLMIPGAVLCAVAAGSVANAQSAAPSQTATAGDNSLNEIVVTGYRKSLSDALEDKLNSPAIVDTIAAEDIGKFPEQNLAESLQRVTGVQIQRNNGEGQYVSIRGLDPKFAQVDLDGRELPSAPAPGASNPANASRSFDYSIMAAEFVSAIDVYKTPTADLNEGGLSGTVNVKTIDPDAVKGQQLVLVAKGNDDINSGKVDPHVTAVFADKLFDDKLGIVLGYDRNQQHYDYDSYLAFGMEPYVGATGSGTNGLVQNWNPGGNQNAPYLFDNAQNLGQYDGLRTRDTLLASLSYRVNEALEFYGQGFYAKKSDAYNWYYEQPRFTNPDEPNSVQSTVLSPAGNGLLQSVTENNVDYRNNERPDSLNNTLSNVAGGVNFTAGALKLNLDGYVAIARQNESNFAFDPIARASVTSTISSGPSTLAFVNGFNPLDPAEYVGIGADGSIATPSEDKISAISLKGLYTFDSDWIKAVHFGARFAKETNSQAPNDLIVSAQTLAGLLGEPYDPVVEGGSFNAAPYLSKYTINFFGQTLSFLGSNNAALAAKVPLSTILQSTPLTENLAATYTITEKDDAGYVAADFAVPGLPLKGNVGVRYVSTSQDSSGYSPNLNDIQYNAQGSTTVIPETTALSVQHTYSNVLPSFNLTYTVLPDLLVRFGAAETMTRPDLAQVAPNTTVNAGVQSISGGNPDLKPYTAFQLDGSVEWYFNKTGLLSLAAYNKSVKNFIQNGSFTETLDVAVIQGGGTRALPFTFLEPENSTTKTNIHGIEVGYQQGFTFLPAPFDGLGVLANYTHITANDIVVTQGSAAVPLSGLSKDNYNAVGYYENGRFGVRVAYNYRGGYVVDPSSYFGDGDYRKGYGQLDASANVRLIDNLDLTLEALNISDNAISDVDKYGISRGYAKYGTTFMFGARYKFD